MQEAAQLLEEIVKCLFIKDGSEVVISAPKELIIALAQAETWLERYGSK